MIPLQTPAEQMLGDWIEAIRCQPSWSRRAKRPPAAALRALLEHARRTVPAYRGLPKRAEAKSELDRFPVVSKEDVAEKGASFLSSAVPRSSLIVVKTSGTTGIPLAVARDEVAAFGFVYASFEMIADRIPAFRSALAPGQTGAVVVTDNPDRNTSSLINPCLGDALVHRLVLGRSEAADEELVETLRSSVVPLLCARPRALLRLAEIDAALPGPHLQPKAILASGDNLYEDDWRRLQAWFGCPLHNAYGSQEGGFAAIDCAHHTGLHILPRRAVVEVLGPDGSLEPEGTGELVLTNLENWAMPFIRYRICDRAVLRSGVCECGFEGPSLLELSGRDAPYFYIDGCRFNPYRLNVVFELPAVRQFQVVQHGSVPPRVRWIPRCPDAEIPAVNRLIAEGFQGKAGTAPGSVEAVKSLGEPGQKLQRYQRFESELSE